MLGYVATAGVMVVMAMWMTRDHLPYVFAALTAERTRRMRYQGRHWKR